MRCPRCGFEGELLAGGCARCGYGRLDDSPAASQTLRRRATISRPLSLVPMPFLRGDVLRQGRYQLVDLLELPRNQWTQGSAWLATLTQPPQSTVVIREIQLPGGITPATDELIFSVALRLAELGRYPGFPIVMDAFRERGSYFIVQQHIKGRSLAQLVEQTGTLDEQRVVDYGCQLCEMIGVMASLTPPFVHGAINPNTVIVRLDRQRVSLIHLPLLPPRQAPNEGRAHSGYLAPEQVHGASETASDLFGLAGTLYHALTAYDPDEHMPFFFPPARRLNMAISPRMEEILYRGLRLSLAHRYKRPEVMQKDLEALRGAFVPTTPIPGQAQASSHAPRPQVETEAIRPVTTQAHTGDLRPIPSEPQTGSLRPILSRKQHRRLLPAGLITAAVAIAMLLLGNVLLSIAQGPDRSPNAQATATVGAAQTEVARQSAQQHAAAAQENSLELQSYRQQHIGISDGRFVFDTGQGRVDASLKTQAAQALQKGDVTTATQLLAQAVISDPGDGEAHIYYEDAIIVQEKLPSIAIVLGTGFGENAAQLAIERNDLRGAFLAQHEINASGLLPHGLRLRLLIGSSGVQADNAATIAQFLANRVIKAGNPDAIIAVAGWPGSAQTQSALSVLSLIHIPLVSQSATDANLSGSSPYFFRVIPPIDEQGSLMGTIAVQHMHAQTILVVHDPIDASSTALAAAFTAQTRTFNVTIVNSPNDYFSEGATSVDAFQNVIGDALAYGANLVVLAGTDVDAVRLAHAVGIAARSNPGNALLARLDILGGPDLATGLLIGQGNGPDADLARTYPQDMRRLNFIAYADRGEFAALHVTLGRQLLFFQQWATLFAHVGSADQNAILTFDACSILAQAAAMQGGATSGQTLQLALNTFGTGTIAPFQGISGRIVFDAQGNPVDKALALLAIEQNSGGAGNTIAVKQVFGTFS